MKKSTLKQVAEPAHFVNSDFLRPANPLTVILIGAGGTGSQVLTALARMNQALQALEHPGLSVTVFDDDIVTPANLGRQLFTTAELGMSKAVALVNRINRFFGTNWKARECRYNKAVYQEEKKTCYANITISCVDNVQARFEIADILRKGLHAGVYATQFPYYWMDFGNSRDSGQVILSTVGASTQPKSKMFIPVYNLPMVTDEFKELLYAAEQTDDTPSCSLAEALEKQDLFINSTLAQAGTSLLWQLFRNGVITNRGFFVNLHDFRMQPLTINLPAKKAKVKKTSAVPTRRAA